MSANASQELCGVKYSFAYAGILEWTVNPFFICMVARGGGEIIVRRPKGSRGSRPGHIYGVRASVSTDVSAMSSMHGTLITHSLKGAMLRILNHGNALGMGN